MDQFPNARWTYRLLCCQWCAYNNSGAFQVHCTYFLPTRNCIIIIDELRRNKRLNIMHSVEATASPAPPASPHLTAAAEITQMVIYLCAYMTFLIKIVKPKLKVKPQKRILVFSYYLSTTVQTGNSIASETIILSGDWFRFFFWRVASV